MRIRHAFTLIELLMVISILAILMGLVTPILTQALRSAKATNTRMLLGKVETALNLFKQDIGTYPYQAHDPAQPLAAGNQLVYHLARRLSTTERSALVADSEAAAANYDRVPHQVVVANIDPRANSWNLNMQPIVVNRMARDRARLAVLGGNTEITGLSFPGYAQSGSRLLPAPTSTGYGDDYLGNDLPARNRRGDAIIDLYDQPLLYVNPSIPGQRGCWPAGGSWAGDDGGHPIAVQEDYYSMQPKGRTITTSLASDIRTTAGESYITGFELWSSGADHRIDAMRDSSLNRDNIAASPYLKGLR